MNYIAPLVLSTVFRITEAWYKDSKNEEKSTSFLEFWYKHDEELVFGTVITITAYYFLPKEAYSWIANHFNIPYTDNWINMIMAFIGIYSLPLYKKISGRVRKR